MQTLEVVIPVFTPAAHILKKEVGNPWSTEVWLDTFLKAFKKFMLLFCLICQ